MPVHGHLRAVRLAGDRPGYNTRRLLRSRQRCRAPDRRTSHRRVRRSGDVLRRRSRRRSVACSLRHLPEGLSLARQSTGCKILRQKSTSVQFWEPFGGGELGWTWGTCGVLLDGTTLVVVEKAPGMFWAQSNMTVHHDDQSTNPQLSGVVLQQYPMPFHYLNRQLIIVVESNICVRLSVWWVCHLRTSILVKLVDHIDFGQLQTTESRTVGCISINFSFLPEVSHVTLFLIWLTPAIAIYVCTCC